VDDRQRKNLFAQHLHQCQARLLGYIHCLVRDLDDAEDLFQQTAVVLWRKFDEFDGARSFFAWACGVARLEAANFLRARGRRKLYFSDELNLMLIEAQQGLDEDEADGRREALTGCVEKLRQRDRQLVETCYGTEGVNAVAQRLGRAPQSVHNSLRRIRRALFECVSSPAGLDRVRAMISDELQDLIDDYLDGALDEAALARLEALLVADEAARAHFVRYCRLHTDLHLEARARQAGTQALVALGQEPAPPARPARRWLGWGAVAAGLALAAGLGWWLLARTGGAPAAEAEVAWLVNAQDCRWTADGPGPMVPGAVLSLESGLAEVRFRAGARVVLEGPARLAVLSASSARLLRGKLAARVPEPASGFIVYSPSGRVLDLGTEFGVAVAEDGTTSVRVYQGEVIASRGEGQSKLRLRRDQSARIDERGVRPEPAGPFVRAIVPPPAIVPRTLALDFRRPLAGTLADGPGKGTGFTHRLPGTGAKLAPSDTNLRLDADRGLLELTTTNSDINRQVRMPTGEYFGVRLADLGFTGQEDFAVSVSIPNIPALKRVGQFGLYAGTRSDRNIRGGLISRKDEGLYTLFLVNNDGGRDRDSHFLGLLTTGDDTRMLLQRKGGKYSLTVENRTTGSSSTLAIRHPAFLDGQRDLHVGVFGANTRSEVSRTITIRDFQATVWAVRSPRDRSTKEAKR
jgi:RNA polymerase sigma-70 factor (ECF subfamily)